MDVKKAQMNLTFCSYCGIPSTTTSVYEREKDFVCEGCVDILPIQIKQLPEEEEDRLFLRSFKPNLRLVK